MTPINAINARYATRPGIENLSIDWGEKYSNSARVRAAERKSPPVTQRMKVEEVAALNIYSPLDLKTIEDSPGTLRR